MNWFDIRNLGTTRPKFLRTWVFFLAIPGICNFKADSSFLSLEFGDRLGDIPPLVHFFITKLCKRLGSQVETVNDSVFRLLQSHSWPGNVRELEAVIERSIIGSDGTELKLFELIEVGQAPHQEVLKLTLDEMTKRYIISILNEVNWKISGKDSASEILDIHPNTLRSLMQRLGVMFRKGSTL